MRSFAFNFSYAFCLSFSFMYSRVCPQLDLDDVLNSNIWECMLQSRTLHP